MIYLNVSIKCFQHDPNYFKEPKKFDLEHSFLVNAKKTVLIAEHSAFLLVLVPKCTQLTDSRC